LKSLVREYYKLTDNCSTYKKKLSTDLRVIFPGYKNVFSNVTSNSSLAILNDYPTPEAVLNAPKDIITDILIKKSKRGLTWAENVYSNLINYANEAIIIGLPLYGFSVKITSTIKIIKTLEDEIKNLLKQIEYLINSPNFSEQIRKNIELINSIPGIGRLTAITIIAEIGDIDGFVKPKHLVAFFGIDSSVNESGKFKGNQNKISKRGT
ncbi:transposase, partial [Clostridium sp. SGI.024]|uniref:transposase n=1 Tax=Clostridium sp. SGI.024 TaxID=3420551 RepID=UPI003D0188FD